MRLVDYMGGDERVVASARVSYGSGTKSFREDRRLIRYLMKHGHTSPFEQVVLTFHIKLPIFVARQWVRHRTARLNEVSGRYSVLKEEFYVPDSSVVRTQSTTNKQGRASSTLSDLQTNKWLNQVVSDQDHLYDSYESALHLNVARELARINLPLSTYTEWYWQIDLHNLFHFLKLRLDSHAQLEIRSYSEVMASITKAVAPVSFEAFEEFVAGAVMVPASALTRLTEYLAGQSEASVVAAQLLLEIRNNE